VWGKISELRRRNPDSMTLRIHGPMPLLETLKMDIEANFFSIGGNRNPAAADWDEEGLRLLAFGADNCIALWDPLVYVQDTSSSLHY
jgi:hypothetical protein